MKNNQALKFKRNIKKIANKKPFKKDLIKPESLVEVFQEIRNYLAGNATGVTRDETLAREIIKVLFCKIYDEENKKENERVDFYLIEDNGNFEKEIKKIFSKVNKEHNNIFTEKDKIELDSNSLKYISKKIQDFSFTRAERDVIRQAFEVFIGPALRGNEGQFFTPRNVIRACVDILEPKKGERIIDPACGSGGFLIEAMRKVAEKSPGSLEKTVFHGIEKDKFLAKIARAYISIIGKKKNGIFCENSLTHPGEWAKETQKNIRMNSYDVLLTNPPFGAKIKIKDKHILKYFDLGKNWKTKEGIPYKTEERVFDRAPQVLFLERSLDLLKSGGRMAIVLPEGLLGNPSSEYIREFLGQKAKVLAIIDASQDTFQPSTHTKTCILFLEKNTASSKKYSIFMGIAKKCGHDSRGKTIYAINKKGELIKGTGGKKIIDDDFPKIAKKYYEFKSGKNFQESDKGFVISVLDIKNNILVPQFYTPKIKKELKALSNNHNLISLAELEKSGKITIFGVSGISKKYYGTGKIPYIRTSEISNFEINTDSVHCVSEEIYQKYKQDLRQDDILFVKDGTYLIGTTCILAQKNPKVLIQSHFNIIRVNEPKKLNPYFLLYLLNIPVVKKQVEAYTVTQSTISTIGKRIYKLVLPIPKQKRVRKKITANMESIIKERYRLKQSMDEL